MFYFIAYILHLIYSLRKYILSTLYVLNSVLAPGVQRWTSTFLATKGNNQVKAQMPKWAVEM